VTAATIAAKVLLPALLAPAVSIRPAPPTRLALLVTRASTAELPRLAAPTAPPEQ